MNVEIVAAKPSNYRAVCLEPLAQVSRLTSYDLPWSHLVLAAPFFNLCGRRDLNPQEFPHEILSLARLPVPPLPRLPKYDPKSLDPQWESVFFAVSSIGEVMSVATTRGVKVEVQCQYVPEKSDPEQGSYFFVYQVRLSNEGDETVQLISRHWIITDATGKIEEVQGPGVVGEQPMLEPGEFYEYSSFCPLPTTQGTMRGTYHMVMSDGTSFDAEIAPFVLSRTEALH